jgi:hypothetical protein
MKIKHETAVSILRKAKEAVKVSGEVDVREREVTPMEALALLRRGCYEASGNKSETRIKRLKYHPLSKPKIFDAPEMPILPPSPEWFHKMGYSRRRFA